MMANTFQERIATYYINEERNLFTLPDVRYFRDPHGFIKKLAQAGFEAFNDDNAQSERDFGSRYRNYYSKPGWKTRCVECRLILTGWAEDDIPIDEHCRAIDEFCGFVIGHYEYLKDRRGGAAAGAVAGAATGAAAADMVEQMSTEPEPVPEDRMDEAQPDPAPEETCSICQAKSKVQYTPCGHLWCYECVRGDDTLHERCSVCLRIDVAAKVYQPDTFEIAQPSVEQRRRAELARALLHNRCDVCLERDKIVLLECKCIVCVHHNTAESCPICSSEVIRTRPMALAYGQA